MAYYKTGKKNSEGKVQYKVVVSASDSEHPNLRKTKHVYGLQEAKDTERRLKQELKEEVLCPEKDNDYTVKDLWDMFCEERGAEIRDTSFLKYEGTYKNYIKKDFESVLLSKLSKNSVHNWRMKLVNTTEINVTTKNNKIRDFKALLRFGLQKKMVDEDVVEELKYIKDPYDIAPESEKLCYYTKEEFLKYIHVARLKRGVSLQYYAMYVFFCIAFFTGMRKGEINALTWLDYKDQTLHVCKSSTQKKKGVPFAITPPKNKASYRYTKVPTALEKVLAEWKAIQMESSHFAESDYICGGKGYLPDSTVERFNTMCSETSGLKHIRIHDFRHSHASLLANAGINIQEVAKRLGHSNVQTTWKIYAHLYPTEEDRCKRMLDEISLPDD